MFAEIYKKAPKLEKWEDVLTSGFFGPLRYTTSFTSVFKKILGGVKFNDESHDKKFQQALDNIKDDWEVRFWEKLKQKEIDLLIISDKNKIVIGLEIKFESELSGNNQLSNYASLLEGKYKGYDRFLIFLAKDTFAKSIYDITYENVISADRNTSGFGYVSWQDFYGELEKIKTTTTTHPDKLIVCDLLKYLKSKNLHGFIRFDYDTLNSLKINPCLKYNFN